MFRQLFLHSKFANLNYSIGALLLKERPTLCAAIGKCIAIWSGVDNEMGVLFSLLFGTENDAALSVFLEIRSARIQKKVLDIAAKHTLKGENLEYFNALISIYISLEKERNHLAHACFGICPEEPNILFSISVDHYVSFQTEASLKESGGIIEHETRHAKFKEGLWVYQISGLEKLYEAIENLWSSVFYFNRYLREPENELRIAEFQQVYNSPQIQQKIKELQTQRFGKASAAELS